MDDRSELRCHEDFTRECEDANFITEPDVRLTEGAMLQNGALQAQGNYCKTDIFRSKSDSILWRKNDRKYESDRSMKDSSNLIVSFDIDRSVTNTTSIKSQMHQLSCFSHNDGSRELSSYNMSISLPIISIPSSDLFLAKDRANKLEDDIHTHAKNITIMHTNEEEALFNRFDETESSSSDLQRSANRSIINKYQSDPSELELDKNNLKEQIMTSGILKIAPSDEKIMNSKLQNESDNDETLSERNRAIEDSCGLNASNSTLTLNVHSRNNLTVRPTLADDSKLVKISLLANPMNIMPSNVQLLNKSRNFLNFITEKSTNIMEKALLPQHLAMRYNHVSKPIDTTVTICANKPSSRNLVSSKSDVNLITNLSSAFNAKDCGTSENKSDNYHTMNNRNETNLSASIKNTIHDLQDETVMNEKKCCTTEKSDISILNCDTIDGQAKSNLLLTEMNENKNRLQIEKLYCDSSSVCTSADTSVLKHGSLEHPLYLMLLEDYTGLKIKHSKLLQRLEYLEKLNKSDKPSKEAQTNIETENLEKTVNKLMADLNASLVAQECLRNECNAVNKEKENMIMKYVSSEKQLIDSQRANDSIERKMKEFLKDQEMLQSKLRQTQGERMRICNILDGKCREIADLQKEIEKLKEDVKMKEIKLKWTQTKLKTEMDLQKDTQQKLDKALMKINDMKEECDQIRRETQESFRKFQQSEENKAVTLDQQLKEHQARLILERYVTEDKEILRLQLQKELDALKSRQQDLIEENKRLGCKIQEFDKARLNYENNLSDLKIVANQRHEQIVELSNKVSQLETLKLQLQHKVECLTSADAQIQELRLINEELQSDIQACRLKEADMLDFTQKLTDKNVHLQSEFNAIQAKVNHLESKQGPLRTYINELTSKVKALETDLMQEQKKRKEECEILANHVAEQTQLAQNLAQKLEDSEGENVVLKRKHQVSIKEMTRELQQCRKKLEMFEASPSNSLDITSRTGSNTSLNIGDIVNGALSDNNANSDHINSVEPNRQLIMDRIIKLQEKNARKDEKIDFLEEHTQVLVEELQKKTKIIQNYFLQQNCGALGCNERDKHKAELARHGGIMASLYNHRASDENMTLELSLEINQKLQAVLEDALLKNITLKDNIDTLGNEIERLKMQHQQK